VVATDNRRDWPNNQNALNESVKPLGLLLRITIRQRSSQLTFHCSASELLTTSMANAPLSSRMSTIWTTEFEKA